ncbi:MAG: PDDEXK nuclease domain-containing protein [Bifidobacteriaceae bacterium]|jgi:predicted nuclease of restriction endonuclease-like (RecB) superfamily|nr:PDDEXK nuclease domain-containing protein [Bifidobacteriaceae bacterium]
MTGLDPTTDRDLEYAPTGYAEWIADVKARVRATQYRAARAVNTEVLRLYWSIGRDILERRRNSNWGAKVLDRAAADLRAEFPGMSGFSRTNLHYMSKVAEAWPTEDEFVQRDVEQLPWGHITVLIDRLSTREDRDWYAAQAVANGWKRGLLEHFIKAGLKGATGSAPTNFATALEPPDSELAQELVKDPYVFEHLDVVRRATERDVEQALMDRLQDTLTEFGRGIAFVGRQVRFEVTDHRGRTDELTLDLLLFSIPQLRYIVVELKVTDFQPAFLGQLSAYVGLVDDKVRDKSAHAPTIGILLCTGKNEAIVRYTLANMTSALGVADFDGLPAEAKAALPSARELGAAMQEELARLKALAPGGEEGA